LARLQKTSEHELIQSLGRLVGAKKTKTRGVVLGIGDDTAVVRPRSGEDLLMTTDVQIEGRLFRREWFSGTELGWRLAAVNLSDIAAMGGKPLYALLSLGIPDDIRTDYVKEIERGVRDHLAKYGASIIGGNISGVEGALMCDMTLVGSVPTGKARRRRCRPNRDDIVVIGPIGEARAGFHMVSIEQPGRPFRRLVQAYKRPTPLLEEADFLRRQKGVHGLIDVSDGFSTDLIHMCRAGNAGCEVDLRSIPLSKTLQEFCIEHGKVALQLALHGGEDYALIASIDQKHADTVIKALRHKTGTRAARVGRFVKGQGSYALIADRGRRMPLRPKGWDHLRKPAPKR
jgi:thiamine-monophosphate kinase